LILSARLNDFSLRILVSPLVAVKEGVVIGIHCGVSNLELLPHLSNLDSLPKDEKTRGNSDENNPA
jgi:hypothetical protein